MTVSSRQETDRDRLCSQRDRRTMEAMNDDLETLSARIDRTNELLQRMLAEVAKTPSTHAIFVDAGYLYAAAGRLVSGAEDRRAFDLDAEGLIEALIDKARTIFRGQPPAARLLVRRRPAPHPHRRAAVHRRTPGREGAVGQSERQQPAEGRRFAHPLRPRVPRPAPRHQRRGPHRRRRGPGVGGGGGAGLRRPGPPVGQSRRRRP